MMARMGKSLLHFPIEHRSHTSESLEERVEVVEAQVDGLIARVEDLERRDAVNDADRKRAGESDHT